MVYFMMSSDDEGLGFWLALLVLIAEKLRGTEIIMIGLGGIAKEWKLVPISTCCCRYVDIVIEKYCRHCAVLNDNLLVHGCNNC